MMPIAHIYTGGPVLQRNANYKPPNQRPHSNIQVVPALVGGTSPLLSPPMTMQSLSSTSFLPGHSLSYSLKTNFNGLLHSESSVPSGLLQSPMMAPTDTVNSQVNGTQMERTSRTNLYIKGLSQEFNDERLKSLVPDPSLIKSVKSASDDGTLCKGYGFIDFVTESAALAAQKYIQQNHASLTVKFAKENEKDTTNLYITNLPSSWKGKKDEERLKEVFEKYGVIQSVHIQTDPTTSRSTGVGFVRFASEEGARKAMEDLRQTPKCLDNSQVALQAKYADKHNPSARARRGNQQPGGGGGKIRVSSSSPHEYLLNTQNGALSPFANLLVRPTAFSYGSPAATNYPNNAFTSLSASCLAPFLAIPAAAASAGTGADPGLLPLSSNGLNTSATAMNNLYAALQASNGLGHYLLANQLPAVSNAAYPNAVAAISNSGALGQLAYQFQGGNLLHPFMPMECSPFASYYSTSLSEEQG